METKGRRHNASHGRGHRDHTTANEEPRWLDMGKGILQLRGNPNCHIKLAGGLCGAFVSVSLKDTAKILYQAPVEAPAPELEAVAS
jgi:hypothetical protein